MAKPETSHPALQTIVPSGAERSLSLGFGIFPAGALILLMALAISYVGQIEKSLAQHFLSSKAVSVFRAGLFFMAGVSLIPWIIRNSLKRSIRTLIFSFSRFSLVDAPKSLKTPVADSVLVTLSAVLAIALVFSGLAFRDFYSVLIAEDGPLEAGSAISWFVACISIAIAYFARRITFPFYHAVYGLLFIFFLVCCGEEISWGQRLIGFQGPAALLEVNKQHETNLHNIGSISLFANGILIFTLAFFFALPRLLKSKLSGFLLYLGFPRIGTAASRVFTFGFVTWIIIGIRYGTLGFHPYSLWGYYTQLDDELFEFFMAFSFMVFALLDALQALKSRK
jgi:hypothetical protein